MIYVSFIQLVVIIISYNWREDIAIPSRMLIFSNYRSVEETVAGIYSLFYAAFDLIVSAQ